MKRLLAILLVVGPGTAWAQFGVNYHQSDLQFFGMNYEIKDRFRPELRLGTDVYLEDFSVELVITYDILNKEDYEVYGGLGIRSEEYAGLAVPVGLNVYPFDTKKFGFHIELAILAGGEDDPILRGSWGIRYRFKKSE